MSLGTTSRALVRTAKKRFPGASDEALHQLVLLQVRIALENPSNKSLDTDLFKLADAAFDKAADEGEEWAVALRNSLRNNIIKPLVDKARDKGVDPVPVVMYETDLGEAEVRAMIEALDAEDATGDSEGDIQPEVDTENDMDGMSAAGQFATAAH